MIFSLKQITCQPNVTASTIREISYSSFHAKVFLQYPHSNGTPTESLQYLEYSWTGMYFFQIFATSNDVWCNKIKSIESWKCYVIISQIISCMQFISSDAM